MADEERQPGRVPQLLRPAEPARRLRVPRHGSGERGEIVCATICTTGFRSVCLGTHWCSWELMSSGQKGWGVRRGWPRP